MTNTSVDDLGDNSKQLRWQQAEQIQSVSSNSFFTLAIQFEKQSVNSFTFINLTHNSSLPQFQIYQFTEEQL